MFILFRTTSPTKSISESEENIRIHIFQKEKLQKVHKNGRNSDYSNYFLSNSINFFVCLETARQLIGGGTPTFTLYWNAA